MTCAGRAGKPEVFDAREVQARVHARYLELAPRVAARVIDGGGAVDDVTARLCAVVDAALGA